MYSKLTFKQEWPSMEPLNIHYLMSIQNTKDKSLFNTAKNKARGKLSESC